MLTLRDIPHVIKKINEAPFTVVKKFYKLLFEIEGNKQSRRTVRCFNGFPFEENTDEYNNKLEFINHNLELTDLQKIANILCLAASNQKEELSKNICNALMNLETLLPEEEDEEEDEEDDEDDGEEDGEEDDARHRRFKNKDRKEELSGNDVENASLLSKSLSRININSHPTPFTMNFRDVEESIRVFEGNNSYPIEKWINDFEDMSNLLRWSELHKFIFAKKSTSGLAKLFIQSEPNINSWKSLKSALLKEFSSKISSAELHQMLLNRKMKKTETVHEYFLIMKELASRGNIEVDALLQYVIDGIPDDVNNKIMLYGASNIEEFKLKLEIYNKIKLKQEVKPSTFTFRKETISKNDTRRKNDKQENMKKPIRCFNCGNLGHKSADCKSKSLGSKCFKCNEYGHIAPNCGKAATSYKKESSENKVESKKDVCLTTNRKNRIMRTNVKIGDTFINALVDTGSDVNLITTSKYFELENTNFNKENITLTGLDDHEIKTLGKFSCNAIVDQGMFFTTFYVIPDATIPVDCIIGNDLLQQAETTIKGGIVEIIQKREEENFSILSINTLHEHDAQPQAIQKLINNYNPKEEKTTEIKMKITLVDDTPIYQHPRRLSIKEKEEVDSQLEDWLEKGIIRPSVSEFASPIVLVKKKDGQTRICVDYRKINQKIVKDRYPLPLIEDQIDQLQGASYFSTLDLENGFFHVEVDESSRKYTSFVTPSGQFEFCKVPFGLCNSPSVFQRYINNIFKNMVNCGKVLTYMDDLIIPSTTYEEGIEKLKEVLTLCEAYGLLIKWKKCKFLEKKIEYLGYEIEKNQIRPSDNKTIAVTKFSRPTTIKQVQQFLGLTGYFRKFVPGYAIIAKPLSDLLKKNETFIFTDEHQASFDALKNILSKKPVLQIYSPNAETELHTDASKYGIGAILFQKNDEDGKLHPIYYYSSKTSAPQQKWISYELEVFAIIQALKKFRVYLLGLKFKIITDCAAFEFTMKKKELATRVARWALLLSEFDYSIEHRAGTRMRHVDCLSRSPVLIIKTELLKRISSNQKEDMQLRAIRKLVENVEYEDYFLRKDILYKEKEGKELIVLPKGIQTEIIKKIHEDNGHFSTKKVKDVIERDYWIPEMDKKIEKCIKNCIPCILATKKQGRQEGYLNPIPKEYPLQTYHIDHLGPLPSTNKNYNYLFVVTDAFTKFSWIYPVKTTSSKEVLSKMTLQQSIFGNPEIIISDRGTAFTSQEFKTYCEEESIKHIMITTGVPRGNGQVERLNRTIISVLTKLSTQNPKDWYKHTNQLQQVLNSTYHRSVNTTPFKLLVGKEMKRKEDILIKELIEEETRNSFDEERDKAREEAKLNIQKIQEENKKVFNRNRKKAKRYEIGALVAIRRTQFTTGGKLKTKFLGPYEVVAVKPHDRYELKKLGIAQEGPNITSSSADNMKPWREDDSDSTSSEADEIAG